MAIPAGTVWEVRTTGNDTNGGGFVTGATGTDYSQQDAKNTVGSDISTTDAVANGTTTITSATANFGTTIVGNIIYLQGGTGALAATRRHVTARTNATTITVDAVVAAGTGITMNIGGACATPGGAAVNFAQFNTMWVKSGTYIQTTATSNAIAGRFNQNGYMIGYGSARGDNGGPPLLKADGVITNFIMVNLTGGPGFIQNIKCDGNNRTGSQAFGIASGGKVGDCVAVNCKSGAFNVSGIAVNCIASACDTTSPFSGVGGRFYACVAKDCTISGFRDGSFFNCIADTCTGATTDGFLFNAGSPLALGCIAYACGRHGFNCASGVLSTIINCIAEDNGASGTGTGFIGVSNPDGMIWANNAAFSNATADFTLGTGKNNSNNNSVTGTGSFFVDPANGDFRLNNTAGAGAAARAVGYPASFNEGLTAQFIDIGVAQHEETGGGGGEHSAVF